MKWLKVENNRLVEPPVFDVSSGKANGTLDTNWLTNNGFRQWTDEEINQWAEENYPTIDQDKTEFNTACGYFRQVCAEIGEMIGDSEFKGGFDDMPVFYNNSSYKTDKGMQLAIAWSGCNSLCKHEAAKLGIGSPEWWYKCWNISTDGGTNLNSDLVKLGILPKQISKYTDADIGSIISIPYNDESGKIALNENGCIEFEVVGVNHHKSIDDESKPTITLMTKKVIRVAVFDGKELNNPQRNRQYYGNNRWLVSNIRQWLNSNDAANEWFTPQHEYDETPSMTNIMQNAVYGDSAAYANDPGFLAGFSDDMKQHFAIVRNKTILCDYDKNLLSKDYEETEDKVFLPSYTEMGFGNLDSNNPEGSPLSQKFTDDESRKKPGEYVEGVGNDTLYWMRTPQQKNIYPQVGHVVSCKWGYDSDGLVNDGSYGIVPLIVLH